MYIFADKPNEQTNENTDYVLTATIWQLISRLHAKDEDALSVTSSNTTLSGSCYGMYIQPRLSRQITCETFMKRSIHLRERHVRVVPHNK